MYPCTQEQYALNAQRYGNDNLNRVKREQWAVRRLVKLALAEGWTVSVHDSEGWTLKRSSDRAAIIAAAMNTDEDSFIFRDKSGEQVGRVFLVYGNDAGDIVCDFTLPLEDWLKRHKFY